MAEYSCSGGCSAEIGYSSSAGPMFYDIEAAKRKAYQKIKPGYGVLKYQPASIDF